MSLISFFQVWIFLILDIIRLRLNSEFLQLGISTNDIISFKNYRIHLTKFYFSCSLLSWDNVHYRQMYRWLNNLISLLVSRIVLIWAQFLIYSWHLCKITAILLVFFYLLPFSKHPKNFGSNSFPKLSEESFFFFLM